MWLETKKIESFKRLLRELWRRCPKIPCPIL
jgi:hypothetical protein